MVYLNIQHCNMLSHYLKIAFRNLLKYKNQTLISVIGLAVGFTCFALATLWIRYEMTYDSFHKNARQMYVIYKPDPFNPSGYSKDSYYPVADLLKNTFPEISNAVTLSLPSRKGKITVQDVEIPAMTISADSLFFRMFDIKILEGSRDCLIPGSKNIAITREKARQMFGNEQPIGKTVKLWNRDLTICAIVSEMSKRSNYAFDFINPFPVYLLQDDMKWNISGYHTVIELFPGTNIEAFEKKLYEYHTEMISKLKMKPLTKIRHLDPDIEREIKFQHIVIFAVSGLLVVVCSLFNYLTLFVSRFRMRQKELALRMVCGASGSSLLVMLSVEFMLTLLFAVMLGCMFTQLAHQPFMMLSEIQMGFPAIYRELLLYIGGVILVSLVTFWVILIIFRYRSLNVSIRRSNKKMFRKVSVIAQLVISIGFAFCTIVILKQMYFLHHADELGFSFQDRGSIFTQSVSFEVLANQLKQIPEITEAFNAEGKQNLLHFRTHKRPTVYKWDDMTPDAERINMECIYVSSEYTAYYNFQLVAGEMLSDDDPDEEVVLLNESAVKAFGWYEPIGKYFDHRKVKGVIRNIYNFGPTIPAKPIYYSNNRHPTLIVGTTVLFQYQKGYWKSCKEKIEQLIQKEYADQSQKIYIENAEEEFNKFLKSENILLKLLSFVSAICILICVFGFVSLVSLTCEERRKEIAIRKVNGATAGDILDMFAKEYFLLLFIGAVIAFTTGEAVN